MSDKLVQFDWDNNKIISDVNEYKTTIASDMEKDVALEFYDVQFKDYTLVNLDFYK